MRRRLAILIGLLTAGLLGLAVARIGPLAPVYSQAIPVAANGGVTEIELWPVPEGPPLSFKRGETKAGGVFPLSPVEHFIPDPLPPPQFQWLCNRGSDIEVILGNGREVTYGPCTRPDSINRLWEELHSSAPPG